MEDTDERTPYEGLSRIYDHVMRHVDYDGWADYVSRVFARLDEHPQTLVDLACGTGNITFELDALGYQLTGIDASSAMISVACDKVRDRGRDIVFQTGDLRALEGTAGPFDAAVCLYDSLNYLLSLEDVELALREVCHILAPSAVFIFDVCTECNSLAHFRDVHDSEEGPGFVYTRHSYYDRDRRLQFNSFDITVGNEGTHLRETHSQRIYTHADMLGCIESSPFELLGAYDGFTFDQGSEHSDRVHFVLRSPAESAI